MNDIIIGRSSVDREKYGDKGVVYLGKHYIKMGRTNSLSNKVYLDVIKSHVVFICGKRGGGKCIVGDSLITLADGTYKSIKDIFVEYSSTGNLVSSEDEYYELSKELFVKSFNTQKKIFENRRVTHIFRRKVEEKLVKWKFPIGENFTEIITTQDHKLLGSKEMDDNFFWASYKDKKYFNYVLSYRDSTNGKLIVNKKRKISDFLEEDFIYFDGYVYDLTVEETHNFVANDILVHNSYTMGVIAEGVADLPQEIKQNISIMLIDTMGVYWTMKYGNKQDKEILDEWDLDAKGLDVKIFTPTKFYEEYKDKGIPTDYPFSIKPSELSGHDWIQTFGLSDESEVAVLIERVIYNLQEQGTDYSVEDILKQVENDKDADKNTKNAAKNRFLNSKTWGLFSNKATSISDMALPGQVTVLDVSCYATMPGSWNVKNLVVGLISEKLFIQRMTARKEEEYREVHKSLNPYSDDDIKKQDFPLVWLVLDEAHEFLPVIGKTLATDPLITILREGRQPGISLILATQQPGKIHTDVMTQSDTVIAHRITAKLDTEALGTLMQSYMRSDLTTELDNLPREKGAAIIFDDTNEKMYPMRVRPRFTWHGGGAPSAIHKKND